MIIQLLGANGAGKSTAVQEVMGVRARVPLHLWGRRVPDAYTLDDVVVAGHYERQACGGGDTLPRDRVRETLRRLCDLGRPVLLEGPTGREPMLDGDVQVVYLKKTEQRCLGNWIHRQHTKGLRVNDEVMGRRVRSTITRCEHMVRAYSEVGIPVHVTRSNSECLEIISRMLGRSK